MNVTAVDGFLRAVALHWEEAALGHASTDCHCHVGTVTGVVGIVHSNSIDPQRVTRMGWEDGWTTVLVALMYLREPESRLTGPVIFFGGVRILTIEKCFL